MEQRDHKLLGWLWQVSGRQKWNILWLTILEILIGGSGVLFAMLLRGVINAAVESSAELFWQQAFYLIGLTALQLILRAGIRFLEELLRSGLENLFKGRLFSVLLNREYANVTAVHSGEWLNRLTSDTVVVAEGLSTILPDLSGMLVQLVGAVVMLLYLIPGIGWLVLPLGFLFSILTFGFRKILKKLHKNIQEKDGVLRIFLSERLTNLMVVRSFVREQETNATAERKMEEHQKARLKRNHFSNLCNLGFGFIMRGSYAAGAIVCGFGILKGTMSYGNLMAVLHLIGQIQSPFANLSGYLPKYYAMLASAERLHEAEGYPQEPVRKKSREEIAQLYRNDLQEIIFDHVTFAYAGMEKTEQAVLKDITFQLRKGEYLAITGHSGCGKSTVLKILMSLYHPKTGEASISTKSGKIILDASYRGLFAYVPQGNQLISGTIREIVAFGDEGCMQEVGQIWKALEIAEAAEFVKELPEGLDARLGERGLGLSEGQIQRLAIARAIMSCHPILLLDEATSSLDEATEKRVLCNLRGMTDRSVIIVTHRMSALEICDKRVILDNISNPQ